MTTWLNSDFIQSTREKCRRARLLPWLLCYVLLVEIAFQFLLKTWSEVLEILLFAAILAVFLALKFVAEGPRGWLRILTDTWTQRLAALFILGIMISFLWGDHSTRSILAFLRLPTYLVIIAMVVETLREEKRIPSFAWTILVGITLVFMLVLVEFYFGSDAVGLKCTDVPRCEHYKMDGWHWEGLLDRSTDIEVFTRHGGNLNASVIAEAYGLSRLGLFSILAYALGIGLIITSGRWRSRLIAGSLLAVVAFGIFISGSRSGTLALPIVLAAFLALSAVSLPRSVVRLTVAGVAVLAAAFLMLLVLPTGFTTFDRISQEEAPKYEIGEAAVRGEAAEQRVGTPVIAYLVQDESHLADDDPIQPWYWQRANAQPNDANAPDEATWTQVKGAPTGEYNATGDDQGKFLRSYVYYEKNGSLYRAETPPIGPIQEALVAVAELPAVETVEEELPAVESTDAELPTVETVEAEPPAVESAEEESPTGEPVEEELPTGEPVEEELPTGEPVEEELPAGESTEEELPAGESTEEELPTGEPEEEELPAVESVEEELPAVESVEEELPAAEPVEEEPPAVESAEEEPPAVEPAEEELPAVEPTEEELSAVEPTEEELPAVEPTEEELPAVEPTEEEPPDVEVNLALDQPRISNWMLALELFTDNPVGGSGFRTFQPEALDRFRGAIDVAVHDVGVHNGYLQVLSESGLIGTLPLLAVLAWSLWVMWRLAPGASANAILWRNAFLSAFAAFLAMNVVDTHTEDRFFWTVLAFAAVVEVWNRQRNSEPEQQPEDKPAEPGPASAGAGSAGR